MIEPSINHRKHLIKLNRLLALGAISGPILFTFAYTILGFLRPGYSLISEPVSGLGVGDNAMAMNASFIFAGALIFAGVIGIIQSMWELDPFARWICFILLELSPIGMILCGLYNYENSLHFVGFILACGSPIICYLVVGLLFRRDQNYRRIGNWLIMGSPLTLILTYMFMTTFDYLNTDVGSAGLIQRILVIEIHALYVALGWLVYRKKSSPA